jgi:RNA polymerase sigma-54 factor
MELNQELEKFLAENPLLEREDGDTPIPTVPAHMNGEPAAALQPSSEESDAESPPQPETYSADVDWVGEGGSGASARDDSDESDFAQVAAESPNLREHLHRQLTLTKLEPRDRNLVAFLIEALDEDGYLTQPLEELAQLVPEELQIEPEELQIALKHLQNLDPTGVGARSCSECLELQLLSMADSTPSRAAALALVRGHLELLAARDFAKLKKALQCGDEELRQAQKLIQSLNPRPGAAFAPLETRYVVSDVVVKKIKGVWVASLNPDALPKLRINRMYADILQSSRGQSGSQLSHQLQEARWLIKNVQQRFETILRVSQAIVDRQRHFFEHGEVGMRPLVLREIANTLGLHESTVSRVTTQKFMFTPRGIFELKYFFGSHVATEAGGACSATAIRALIKQFIAAEDGRRPLSDSKISEILGQQGIMVARRTIAKYRESLQIPSVSMRKSL